MIYIEFSLLFVSNSQVIGCEDRLRNDLYCVGWGVKLYSIQSNLSIYHAQHHIVYNIRKFKVLSFSIHNGVVCVWLCVNWIVINWI